MQIILFNHLGNLRLQHCKTGVDKTTTLPLNYYIEHYNWTTTNSELVPKLWLAPFKRVTLNAFFLWKLKKHLTNINPLLHVLRLAVFIFVNTAEPWVELLTKIKMVWAILFYNQTFIVKKRLWLIRYTKKHKVFFQVETSDFEDTNHEKSTKVSLSIPLL